jgi:hypothetical protein
MHRAFNLFSRFFLLTVLWFPFSDFRLIVYHLAFFTCITSGKKRSNFNATYLGAFVFLFWDKNIVSAKKVGQQRKK